MSKNFSKELIRKIVQEEYKHLTEETAAEKLARKAAEKAGAVWATGGAEAVSGAATKKTAEVVAKKTGTAAAVAAARTGAMSTLAAESAVTKVGKSGLARIGAWIAKRAGLSTLGPVGGVITLGLVAWEIYDVFIGDDEEDVSADEQKEITNAVIQRVKQSPSKEIQQIVKKASESVAGSVAGLPDRFFDPSGAQEDLQDFDATAPDWFDSEPEIEDEIWNNPNLTHDAYIMYNALKGWGTDEETVYKVLDNNKLNIRALYDEFNKVLKRKDDVDDGDIIDWLKDDGEDEAAMLVKQHVIQNMGPGGNTSSKSSTRRPRRRSPHMRGRLARARGIY